jgi:hypothetical protein
LAAAENAGLPIVHVVVLVIVIERDRGIEDEDEDECEDEWWPGSLHKFLMLNELHG